MENTPVAEQTLSEMIESGVRLMWVAAHPDDESFVGPILAKAAVAHENPVHFVVLTHGEGGLDARSGQRPEDLAALRAKELGEVVRRYGVTLRLERFFNAPLPMSSFPSRDELARIWSKEGDPAGIVAEEIRKFRPDVVLTFSPVHGATGHPEHTAASRFAMEGIRRAVGDDEGLTGEPFRVPHCYAMLNRYWFARLFGAKLDPLEPTETFKARQPCKDGRTCVQIAADYTRPHETQRKLEP